MSEPSPSEMIRWFRDKAREFSAIADTLERTFPGGGANASTPLDDVSRREARLTERVINIDQIVGLLKTKAGRSGDIADTLGCTKETVDAAVAAHPDLFEVGERGWIRLKNQVQEPEFSISPAP